MHQVNPKPPASRQNFTVPHQLQHSPRLKPAHPPLDDLPNLLPPRRNDARNRQDGNTEPDALHRPELRLGKYFVHLLQVQSLKTVQVAQD